MALEPRDIVKARPVYNSIVLVASSVMMGIFVLAGMALWLDGVSSNSVPPKTANLVLAVFLIAAAASIAVSVFARRFFLARASSSTDIDEAIARYRTGVIVACAFGEFPAGLGFAWIMLGGSLVWMPAFFGSALLAVGLAIPMPRRWEEWLAGLPRSSG